MSTIQKMIKAAITSAATVLALTLLGIFLNWPPQPLLSGAGFIVLFFLYWMLLE